VFICHGDFEWWTFTTVRTGADFLFRSLFEGLLVRRRRYRREFSSLDAFPGLPNLASALRELNGFCSHDRSSDPIQLCALGLFDIILDIFCNGFDSSEIVDFCLRILVHFTDSEFADFYPFSRPEFIDQFL
jgi:hypothetical protein